MSDLRDKDKKDKKEDKSSESGGAAAVAEVTSSEEKPKPSLLTYSSDGKVSMDTLRDYLARSLGIKENPPSQLEELTLKGIATYLASDKCKNVITMAGAGISTAAGIPDFRSPGTGLYDNLASYDLPTPQSIFDVDFFKENPKPFFVLAKELYPGAFKPTLSHYFIKLLNDKGKLLRHYTQNIDTLERVAGLDSAKLVEAHGTFHTSHCLTCGLEYQQDWMKEKIFADTIPTCELEDCEGVIKPDIVFFGESLPQYFAQAVSDDFQKCDLLIVTGTSLTVQPFASLTQRVPPETPRLYINLEKGESNVNPLTVLFFGGGGFNFDGEDNYRDVFKGATCDEGCQELADMLGWGDELRAMVKSEHERIDRESARKSGPPKARASPAPTTKKLAGSLGSSSPSPKTTTAALPVKGKAATPDSTAPKMKSTTPSSNSPKTKATTPSSNSPKTKATTPSSNSPKTKATTPSSNSPKTKATPSGAQRKP